MRVGDESSTFTSPYFPRVTGHDTDVIIDDLFQTLLHVAAHISLSLSLALCHHWMVILKLHFELWKPTDNVEITVF